MYLKESTLLDGPKQSWLFWEFSNRNDWSTFSVILATWAVVDLNFDCATTRASSPLICLCTPQNPSEKTTVRGNVSQPEIKSAKTWIFRVAEIVAVLR